MEPAGYNEPRHCAICRQTEIAPRNFGRNFSYIDKRCFETMLRALLPRPASELPVPRLFEHHVVITRENQEELKQRLKSKIAETQNGETRGLLNEISRMINSLYFHGKEGTVLKKGIEYVSEVSAIAYTEQETDKLPDYLEPECSGCMTPIPFENQCWNSHFKYFHERCFAIVLRALSLRPESELPDSNSSLFEEYYVVATDENKSWIKKKIEAKIAATQDPDIRNVLSRVLPQILELQSDQFTFPILFKGNFYRQYYDVKDVVDEFDKLANEPDRIELLRSQSSRQ